MITVKMLRELRACQKQIDTFVEIFGESAPMDVQVAVDNADKFDWKWIAVRTLTDENWKVYYETCFSGCLVYEEAFARTFAELYIKQNS